MKAVTLKEYKENLHYYPAGIGKIIVCKGDGSKGVTRTIKRFGLNAYVTYKGCEYRLMASGLVPSDRRVEG
jgi:hypothetical protein